MVITSPCIQRCALKDNVCAGCFRTKEEISSWGVSTNEQRQQIIDRCSERQQCKE